MNHGCYEGRKRILSLRKNGCILNAFYFRFSNVWNDYRYVINGPLLLCFSLSLPMALHYSRLYAEECSEIESVSTVWGVCDVNRNNSEVFC